MEKKPVATEKGTRTCIACMQKHNKRDMFRILRTPNDTICLDISGRAAGRGAYVCSLECLNNALLKRKFNRAFKREIHANEAMHIKNALEAILQSIDAR